MPEHIMFCQIINLLSFPAIDLKVFYSNAIDTSFCCFLGGGDISFINGKNSAVISMPNYSEEGPPSPLRDGESIVSGCIETKAAEWSNDKILGQLVSNMTICIAKSLETMTVLDLKSLKVASWSYFGLPPTHPTLQILNKLWNWRKKFSFETISSKIF